MKIIQLIYFNESIGSAEYSSLDDPYIQNLERKTTLSKKLRWEADPLQIRWTALDEEGNTYNVELKNSGRCEAVVSQDGKYVIAVFSGSVEWPWPSNAAVFNADGSLRGKITPPQRVTPEPIEGIGGVKLDNSTVVLWCYYNYDQLAYIEFDPESMVWGEVRHIGGRA